MVTKRRVADTNFTTCCLHLQMGSIPATLLMEFAYNHKPKFKSVSGSFQGKGSLFLHLSK